MCIYRHKYLVSANPVHIGVDSVYGASQVMGQRPHQRTVCDVEFYPLVKVVNDGSSKASVIVNFDLIDDSGNNKGTVTSQTLTIDPRKTVSVNATITKVSNVGLWSLSRPYLYKLKTSLMSASDALLLDS